MNILLLRTSAMGDIIHSLPVLTALRKAMPKARIGWVVEKVFAPMLEDHADLDELFIVRSRVWRKQLLGRETRREIVALRRSLRAFKADVALDLMGNHKAGVLARLSGAKRIAGATRRERREPSSAIWMNRTVPVEAVHAVDRALDLLAAFDLPREPADFGPDKLMPDTTPEAERFLADREGPFLLIQAGAGWVNKTYPTAAWGEVAKQLHQQTGYEIWLPMAPGEEELARAIERASEGAAHAFEAYAFPTLAAVLRRSILLLGGDTGPLHLAHALGTPVLCLMGPTDPLRNGPYGEPDRAVFHRLPCSFCHKRFTIHQDCMLQLSPEVVVAKALELLSEKTSGTSG